jgi:hypothetical protein
MLLDTELILRDAGFKVERRTESNSLIFESANLLGFVCQYQAAADLIERWSADQARFLKQHAAKLRTDPLKAWNIYSIFITPEPVDSEQKQQLEDIEEDFNSTRKIARGGIGGRSELQRALLPILPISTQLVTPGTEAESLVLEKLSSEEADFFRALRAGDEQRLISAWIAEAHDTETN